jgi:hypothetical protein
MISLDEFHIVVTVKALFYQKYSTAYLKYLFTLWGDFQAGDFRSGK